MTDATDVRASRSSDFTTASTAGHQSRSAGRRPASLGPDFQTTATPLWETVVTPAVVWKLIEASPDGIALAAGDGALVLVNRRMEEMFGYDRTEMLGSAVERLIPGGLRAAHREHRAGYRHEHAARPMGAGLGVLGLRKDGSTFPVEINLSPMHAGHSEFTIAVVRDVTQARQVEEAAQATAVLASQDLIASDLHDRVVSKLFHVGLDLQGAVNLPADAVRDRVLDAVQHLDETIREIRNTVFRQRSGQ